MSLTTFRTDVALALGTVPGVSGFSKMPTSIRQGDAWPRLDALDRGPGEAFQASWIVVVVLPSDERTASDWIDTKYEDLVEALEPYGFVDRLQPALMTTDAGSLQVLEITMRGE